MEESGMKTEITFAEPEELQRRQERIKSFRNRNNQMRYLLDSDYEQTKVLTDLMLMEGLSEEFIALLLAQGRLPAFAPTLDFLHCAALILGEEYVKEHLLGKHLSFEDGAREIREHYHTEQMKPYEEMYPDLKERMEAAKEGEQLIAKQMEILKLKSDHAEQIYQQRMEQAKMQFDFQKQIIEIRAAHQEENARLKINSLETELEKARSALQDLEKKNGGLVKEQKLLYEKISARQRRKGLFAICHSNEDAASEEEITASGKAQTRTGAESTAKKMTEEAESEAGKKVVEASHPATPDISKQMEDRREFCLAALSDKAFTGEQIGLLLPCLQDETIPLSTLQRLCNPDLPADNMRTFIRFIEGGKTGETEK